MVCVTTACLVCTRVSYIQSNRDMGLPPGLRHALRDDFVDTVVAKKQAQWDAANPHSQPPQEGGNWRTDPSVRPYQDMYAKQLPLDGSVRHAIVVDAMLDLRRMMCYDSTVREMVDLFTGVSLVENLLVGLGKKCNFGEGCALVLCVDNGRHVPLRKKKEQAKRIAADKKQGLAEPYPNGCVITDEGLQIPGTLGSQRFSVSRLIRNPSLRLEFVRYLIDFLERRAGPFIPAPNCGIIVDHLESGAVGFYKQANGTVKRVNHTFGAVHTCKFGEGDMQCAAWAYWLQRLHIPVVVRSVDGDMVVIMSHVSSCLMQEAKCMKRGLSHSEDLPPLVLQYRPGFKDEKYTCVHVHRFTHYITQTLRLKTWQLCQYAGLCKSDYTDKIVFKNINETDMLHYLCVHRRLWKKCEVSKDHFVRLVAQVWATRQQRSYEVSLAKFEAKINKSKPSKPKPKAIAPSSLDEQWEGMRWLMRYWMVKWTSFSAVALGLADYLDAATPCGPAPGSKRTVSESVGGEGEPSAKRARATV